MFVEVSGNVGDAPVLSHQNGHLVEADTLCRKAFHFLGQLFQGRFRVRPLLGVLQEGHLYEALFLLLGTTLPHVAVRLFQLGARHALFLLIAPVQCLAGRREKLVVEADDACLTSPVCVERTFLDAETPVIAQSRQDFPVAASPAVDALLDVAHDEAAFLLCQTFLQQQMKVLPLHA